MVAPISSSCTLPALKLAISLHAPPSCFVALLVMTAGPMVLLKSPLDHQQPIRASDQLGLTSVSTWVDIILKAKKLDSFPRAADALK